MAFTGQFGKQMPPFDEAVAYWLRKRVVSREEFEALSLAERARAFTAARVFAADKLNAVYNALDAVIRGSGGLREFQDVAREILTRPGQMGLVFNSNVGGAYGAGHLVQAQQARLLRPYGKYVALADARPSHLALHGQVYPLDHPFWLSFWPPWDHN